MDVVGSDGAHVGTVDHVAGDRIKLTRHDSGDGEHHFVPLSWVASVDGQVTLDRPAGSGGPGGGGAPGAIGAAGAAGALAAEEAIRSGFGNAGEMASGAEAAEQAAGAGRHGAGTAGDLAGDAAHGGVDRIDTINEAAIDDGSATLGAGTAALGGAGAAATVFAQDPASGRGDIAAGEDGVAAAVPGWMRWVLVAIGVVLLVLLARSCMTAPGNTAAGNTVAGDGNAVAAAGAGAAAAPVDGTPNAAAAAFLASSAAAPRSFVVDGIAFRPGSAFVVASFQPSIAALVAMLKAHPNARIRLTGFTDDVGSAAANHMIGQRRADNVKAAVVGGGIAAARIETDTGAAAASDRSTATLDDGGHGRRRVGLTILSK